jgi:hypothetical protein
MSSSLGKNHDPASMTAKAKMRLGNAVIIGKIVCSRWFPTLTLDPSPMTKIRFDYGTVTISDGVIQAPSPTLTALLDALAATMPGYGSIPFILDEDFNIAQGLIRMVGVGKIVRRDRMPSSLRDVAVTTRGA